MPALETWIWTFQALKWASNSKMKSTYGQNLFMPAVDTCKFAVYAQDNAFLALKGK